TLSSRVVYLSALQTLMVLNPLKQADMEAVKDTDLAGPLVFCLAFGGALLLTGKLHFGYIYGIGVTGCLALYMLLNMMNTTTVQLTSVMSTLGYCLLPMCLLSLMAVVVSLRSLAGIILTSLTVAWCAYSSSKLFVNALSMDHQRLLVAYPCALVYGVFALLTACSFQLENPTLLAVRRRKGDDVESYMYIYSRRRTNPAMQLLLISLLLPSLAAAQSTMETTTKPMEATTTPNIGGFTSDQLGVLIGIPVALVIIIIIGVIIGCVVQHKVHQEDKLLEGKPYQDQGDVGPAAARPWAAARLGGQVAAQLGILLIVDKLIKRLQALMTLRPYLPQEKVRQSGFARGSYQQVGRPRDRRGVTSSGSRRPDRTAWPAKDTAWAMSSREVYAKHTFRRALLCELRAARPGGLHDPGRSGPQIGRQQLQIAQHPDADPVGPEPSVEFLPGQPQEAGHLLGAPVEILDAKSVDGHFVNAQVAAPFQHFANFLKAAQMALRFLQAVTPGESPIAVHDNGQGWLRSLGWCPEAAPLAQERGRQWAMVGIAAS
uniref:Yip1 domain-containing protein n=1 Tax=Macrostomum lignano TaxID=282301 RepID=A0A1I8GUK5_9PLAT